jgi:hypothetical protein
MLRDALAKERAMEDVAKIMLARQVGTQMLPQNRLGKAVEKELLPASEIEKKAIHGLSGKAKKVAIEITTKVGILGIRKAGTSRRRGGLVKSSGRATRKLGGQMSGRRQRTMRSMVNGPMPR